MEDARSNQTLTLNDLPEELLLHILTFLPTLDSVKTSLISQKWRLLWSRVPSLDFPFELFSPRNLPPDFGQAFADSVDRVLIRRSKSPIHTFRLNFIYYYRYSSHVDSWVHAAVHRLRARRLHLDFFIHSYYHNGEIDNDKYDFPLSVLRNGSIETLSLNQCDLTLPENLSTMRFSSIRSMILDQVFLTDQMMRDLISSCPNLVALELRNHWGHHHMRICSSRLKKLVLGQFYESDQKESIVVDCPNLCSISFDCCGFDRMWLKNASSVVEFRLWIPHWVNVDSNYSCWSKVARLLEQAPNIKHLDVQNWWFKFLTSKDSLPKSFMLHNLSLLELKTGYTQYDLLGMAALLKLCPNLETLILHYLYKIGEDESLSEELLNKPVEFSTPSLKHVRMSAYTGTEDEHSFLKIFKHGVALKEIVLVHAQVGVDFQVGENVEIREKSLPQVDVFRKASQGWQKYSQGSVVLNTG